jgi:hypothetical protein
MLIRRHRNVSDGRACRESLAISGERLLGDEWALGSGFTTCAVGKLQPPESRLEFTEDR